MGDLDEKEKSWVQTAVPVLEGVMERREGHEDEGLDLIREEFSVPGDPPRYVDLLKGLYDELADPEREREYILKPGDTSPEHVISYLRSKALESGKALPHDTTKAIYLMVRAGGVEWPWEELLQAIDDKLSQLIVEKEDGTGQISDVAIGSFAGLIGTFLVLAGRCENTTALEALNGLEEFAYRGDLFIAVEQARSLSHSYASCILAVLYLNREKNKGGQIDPFSSSQAFQSSIHEGAYRRGREQYLNDIKEPEELDEALYHASVLAKEADIEISDEMNHPEHDHSSLIERLRQKMTDTEADLDPADL